MKARVIYTMVLFCVVAITKGQTIIFSNINFKNKLLQADVSNNIAAFGWDGIGPIGGLKIDANSDGEIQQSEALAVTYLNVGGASISNLSGLEYFTNLRWLSITSNAVTSFNFPQLVNIEFLGVYGNQLISLNVSTYTNLKTLIGSYNQIASLNFTGLLNLKRVYCSHNQLTSLDFSGNPLFEDLGCSHNNLTSLKIRNGRMQLFGTATLYNECWSNNPNLTSICADDFEINGLQSHLANCGITQPIVINSSCALGIDEINYGEVKVFPNPSNGIFTLDLTNELFDNTDVRIYTILGFAVYHESLASGELYQVDLSKFAKGIYIAVVSSETKNQSFKLIKN